jgi:hypothetical protein
MARLFTFVTNTILLTWAITRKMTNLTTVIAFLTLGTITGQMSVATTGVASLGASAGARGVATWLLLLHSASSALAGDVSYLTTLITLGTVTASREGSGGIESALGGRIGGFVALAREMTSLATSIAGFLFCGLGAVPAHMTIQTTVVANRSTTLRAFTGLVTRLATVVASTVSCEFHFERLIFDMDGGSLK